MPSRIAFDERLGRRFEPPAIRVERGERPATAARRRRGAARRRSARSRPTSARPRNAFSDVSGAQNLVVLLEQPRRRALARSRAGACGSHASIGGSIVKSSRAASATARSIRTGSSLKPHFGIADRSDDAGAQIVEAADVVDDREGRDVVEERVDREVAAERVLFGRAERVVVVDQVLAFRRRRIGRRDAVLHDLLARLRPGGGTSRPR